MNDASKSAAAPATGFDEKAELMLTVANRLAATRSLDEVLQTLVAITAGATGAERGSLFLHDPDTHELYSRIAIGGQVREIRVVDSSGIAGLVFTTGTGVIVDDAYDHPSFNRGVDEQTGFRTRNILCAPVRTVDGEVIGVAQCLNKTDSPFSEENLGLLAAMCTQAAAALRNSQALERMERSRQRERAFLDVVADITAEIDIGTLLQKVMREVTRMLSAERSTLFLNDERTGELWSQVGQGLGATQIRMPNHVGIAGAVFTTGDSVNIPHAYADLRFNPAFDRQTGFFTRSVLCVPVVNKNGKRIGVTQVLNKIGGPFTEEDAVRLRAFTAQVSMALENANLFNDVQTMKNYNDSMLQSMSNGVITLDDERRIVTCNAAGARILKRRVTDLVDQPAAAAFDGPNAWLVDRVARVEDTHAPDVSMDGELRVADGVVSVNVTVLPLQGADRKTLGTMLMIEDISTEKRVKSTMSRYMDPSLADRLLQSGEEILGGKSVVATILFSDVRRFTTLTEQLGPQGTVSLLNEYFTIMVDCLHRQAGMLDKFIGDAIMATFGIPIPTGDDEDRAVRAAVSMIRALGAWNDHRRQQGLAPVEIGIGLNTDVVVSGNIGSPKRMDYTVIGDGVNLAARLEGACKQYGAQILVSENTHKRLRGTYRMREVDRVVVKGKSEPVTIYEVLDYLTEEDCPRLHDLLAAHREGIELYRRGEFVRAGRAFEEALAIRPEDQVARLYVDRCTRLAVEPVEESWSGVWVLTEK